MIYSRILTPNKITISHAQNSVNSRLFTANQDINDSDEGTFILSIFLKKLFLTGAKKIDAVVSNAEKTLPSNAEFIKKYKDEIDPKLINTFMPRGTTENQTNGTQVNLFDGLPLDDKSKVLGESVLERGILTAIKAFFEFLSNSDKVSDKELYEKYDSYTQVIDNNNDIYDMYEQKTDEGIR